jgi:hypothetical protein
MVISRITYAPQGFFQGANNAAYDFFIFADNTDGNKIKAFNGNTGRIDHTHATDFGSVYNACVDALPSTGGKIMIDSGTFLTTTTCKFKNYISVYGSGANVTIIKLANGANVDVMATPNLTSMISGRPTNGYFAEAGVVHDVTIEAFSVDGNKANNATGRYGIGSIHYAWNVRDIIIYNCKSDGWYSEWGTVAGCPQAPDPTGRCMEDYIVNLYTHHCEGWGMTFRGPHDTYMMNFMAWGCTAGQARIEALAAAYSGGCQINNYHAFAQINSGTTQTLISALVVATNMSSEGGLGAGGCGIKVVGSGKLQATALMVFVNETGVLLDTDSSFCNLDGNFFANKYGIRIRGIQHYIKGFFYENTKASDGLSEDSTATDIVLGEGGGTPYTARYNTIKARCTKSSRALDWANSANFSNDVELTIGSLTAQVTVHNEANISEETNKVDVFTDINSADYKNHHYGFNVFRRDAAAQSISSYRAGTTSVGTGSGIQMALDDSAGNRTSYGEILARIVDATDTSEDGQLSFYTMSAAALAERMVLTDTGILQIGNNLRLRLSESGLTAARVITFPDATALLASTNLAAQVFTEEQIMRKDTADLLTLHRSNNGTVGTGIAFNLGSSNPGNQYAKMYGFAVTSSPLVGRFEWWLADSGPAAKRLALLSTGALETQSYLDLTKISAPADPGAEAGRVYFKQIDANNNGLFVKLKQAGSIVEVQIAP